MATPIMYENSYFFIPITLNMDVFLIIFLYVGMAFVWNV